MARRSTLVTASCHGDKGEGVPDEYDEPLQGERSSESLASVTSWHGFKVVTPNGARFHPNTIPREGDSNARDDSGARRRTASVTRAA